MARTNTFHDVCVPNAGASMSNLPATHERSAATHRSFTDAGALHVYENSPDSILPRKSPTSIPPSSGIAIVSINAHRDSARNVSTSDSKRTPV